MSTQAAKAIAVLLSEAVKRGDVAGASFGAVDRHGNVFVEETAGVRALGGDAKVCLYIWVDDSIAEHLSQLTLDTIFPMFSDITKAVPLGSVEIICDKRSALTEAVNFFARPLATVSR